MTGTGIERRLAELRRLDETRLPGTAHGAFVSPGADTARAWRELRRRRERSRAARRRIIVAGAAALATAAVAAAVIVPAMGTGQGRPGPGHPGPGIPSPSASGPVRVDHRAIVARIPLANPGQVVQDGRFAWTLRRATADGRYQLVRIDVRSDAVTLTVNLGLDKTPSVTAGGGAVWVTTGYGEAHGQVARIDPATGRAVSLLHLRAGQCSDVSYSPAGLWVTCATSPKQSEFLLVSLATGKPAWTAGPVPRYLNAAAITPDGVWYAGGSGIGGMVRQGSRVRVRRVRDASYPVSFAGHTVSMVYAAGYLWVLTADESVAKIDPATAKVVRVYTYQTYDPAYDLGLASLAVRRGSLWFLDLGTAATRGRFGVLRVSEATGRPVAFAPVGGQHACGEPCVALFATPAGFWVPTSTHLVRIDPSLIPAGR